MAINYGKVVDTAMSLRSMEPELWNSFVMAVQQHAAEVLSETLRCPPELLQRAQGMAIEASEFAGALVGAPQLYEKRLQALASKQRTGGNHA
jgi:hypothetical protein